jgi:hypothetical protein
MSVSERESFSSGTTLNPCHPERSLAMGEAHRQTESKDPLRADTTSAHARSFLKVLFRILS